MATKTPSTRSRSTATKRAPRRRAATSSPAASTRSQALTTEAKTAIRSVRTRATRAAKKIPTDRTSMSIAAGVIAGLVAAGVAIFMNRDRLRTAASTSGEKLKQAADNLSTIAHEKIDSARDNITRFRSRSNGADTATMTEAGNMAVTG